MKSRRRYNIRTPTRVEFSRTEFSIFESPDFLTLTLDFP